MSVTDPRYVNALDEGSIADYFGRVLVSDKRRGEPLTPSDFLPAGAKPGIAAIGRAGFSLLPIADREIEGLDAFNTDDRIAVLVRGEANARPAATQAALGFQPSGASVVSQNIRLAKASTAGQTILEVRNDELAVLQAALAQSLSNRELTGNRSRLVAVGLHRQSPDNESTASSEIQPFDPLAGIHTTELIIGDRRSVQVFRGDGS